MLTDLVQIRRLEQQQHGENARFRAYLKSHRHSDRRLRRFGEEIEAQIDCTACANCCRVTEVGITDKDVEKLAKFVGTSQQEFVGQFRAMAISHEHRRHFLGPIGIVPTKLREQPVDVGPAETAHFACKTTCCR